MSQESQRGAHVRTNHGLRQETAWAVGGRVVATASAFGSAAVAARLLSPTDFGVYLLALSVSTVGGSVARLGLDRAVVRLVAERMEAGDRRGLIAVLRSAIGATAVGSLMAVVILAGPLGEWFTETLLRSDRLSGVLILLALWTGSEGLRRTFSEAPRGFGDIRGSTVTGDPARWLLLLIAFGLMSAGDPRRTLEEILAAALVTSVVTLAMAAAVSFRRARLTLAEMESPDRADVATIDKARVLIIAIPMLVAGLGSILVGQGDLWVVSRYLGEEAVATYGSALRLAVLLQVPLMAANAVLPPHIVRLHARGDHADLERLLRSYTTYLTVPATMLAAVLIIGAEPVLEAAFGGFASEGATVLRILASSQLLAVATGSCGVTLLMTGHERFVAVTTLATSALLLTGAVAVAAAGGGSISVAAVSGAGTVGLNLALTLHARRALGIWTHLTLRPAPISDLV